MRKTIYCILTLLAAALTGVEATGGNPAQVPVNSLKAERHGKFLNVDMNIGLGELNVSGDRCVLLTPRIVNGGDAVSLPSVAVYGRRSWFWYKRNFRQQMLSGSDETSFMARKRPETIDYSRMVPWQEWMDGASIILQYNQFDCSDIPTLSDARQVGRYREAFFPELLYITPPSSREKRRTLEGRAYVDFPVDQTVIYPDYRRNAAELAAIRATIDTVRNDADAKIETVWLKGFASPESPYSHNTELAIGRTAAVKNYIQQIYNFDQSQIVTDYEPEDWEGLRHYVENSNLEHRAEILELIDSDREPDAKEWVIKRNFPQEYRFMLDNWYPALRHTDYRVSYIIRQYSNPDEIMGIMRTRPQKLDLNEFYVAASVLEPGSDEFTEVFETAVRMYPDDEAANLNAANAAIRRGNYDSAERYLAKAGDSPEALYGRAALAIRREQFDAARSLLSRAAAAGLTQASQTLQELEERLAESGGIN